MKTMFTSDNTYYTEDTEEEADFKDTDTKVKNEINLANFLVPVTKRKRVRKRRPRNRSQSHILHSDINDEEKPKKPRIIDSYVIPSRKHIKFNIEDNENDVAKKIVQEVSGNESSGGIYKDLKNFSSRESSLSSLLALRQCSTPKTYVNNKIKVIRVESLSNKEIKTNIPNIIKVENVKNIEKNSCDNSTDKQIHKENLKGSELAMEDYSVMNRKPQVEDIIAFKVRIFHAYTYFLILYYIKCWLDLLSLKLYILYFFFIDVENWSRLHTTTVQLYCSQSDEIVCAVLKLYS